MKNKITSIIKTENIAALLFFIYILTLPLHSSMYVIQNFSYFYVTIILALSLSLIWGYSGIFSFGQSAFMGIGSYTYSIAMLATQRNNSLLAVILAIIVPTAFAILLGYFIFYGGIGDSFVALITLCVSTALETFMYQTSGSQWKIAGVPLGGYNGINSVPAIHIGDFKINKTYYYYLVVAIIIILFFVLKVIAKSNWGYSLFGVREGKERSEMFGYNTKFIQTSVFGVGGAIAGVAGALFSSGQNYVVPTTLGTTGSITAIVMVAAAGKKSPAGVMIMTLFYCWFSQKLAGMGSQYGNLILGALLVLVVLFVPDGLLATAFRKIDDGVVHILKKSK